VHFTINHFFFSSCHKPKGKSVCNNQLTRRIKPFEKNNRGNSHLQKFNQNPSYLACKFPHRTMVTPNQFKLMKNQNFYWLISNLAEFGSACVPSSSNSVPQLTPIEANKQPLFPIDHESYENYKFTTKWTRI